MKERYYVPIMVTIANYFICNWVLKEIIIWTKSPKRTQGNAKSKENHFLVPAFISNRYNELGTKQEAEKIHLNLKLR